MADLLAPPSTLPDLMNDPEYDTNIGDGEDGMADVNLCRICRGEGSDAEPLFHPCKCSGSIKFVHQDCLMEWLSHSQKKHCELCKTPFRFTKLYSPNMPHSLPILVLFRHVIIHIVKNMATWLRFFLVATVWLGVLPFTIRQIWRVLFWFSDGGWPTNPVPQSEAISTGMSYLRQFQAANLAEKGTCPVSPLQASPTTQAGVAGIVDTIIGLWNPASQQAAVNSTLSTSILKSLAHGLGIDSESSQAQPPPSLHVVKQPSSLLSEVSLLRNLTKYPSINRLVINITEGYIITFLVVFCFILVFLIREWVVQQQPGINMGAGFNANAEFAGAPDRVADQQLVPLPALLDGAGDGREQEAGNRLARRRREGRQINLIAIEAEIESLNEVGPITDQEHMAALQGQRTRIENDDGSWEDTEDSQENDAGPINRPPAVRDALSPAFEVQRMLSEGGEPRMTEEFLAIWRRADSNPGEVLRIIEEENKGEQMSYWANAMRILQHPVPHERDRLVLPSSSAGDSIERTAHSSEGTRTAQAADQPLSPSFESAPARDAPELTADTKGKGKAQDDFDHTKGKLYRNAHDQYNEENAIDYKGGPLEQDETHAIEQQPETIRPMPSYNFQTRWPGHELPGTRPRSMSDGPAIRDSISPLAHNSWSFAELNDEEEDITIEAANTAANTAANSELLSMEHTALEHHVPSDEQISEHRLDMEYDSRPVIEDGPVEIIGLDGVTRVHQDGDEVFENNPIGDSDSETEEESGIMPDLFPETILPETVLPRQAEPLGVVGTVADFLWGGVGDDVHQDEPGPNEEHIVHDLADEAPFVPVAHPAPFPAAAIERHDQEVLEAALAAGLDPNDADAIDDAEDFDGIMELVGMRGPIFSLVQNALFSVFLLALTVAIGVWIPYNIGRVSLLLVANPGPAFKLPLRFIFGCAALIQDFALLVGGMTMWGLIALCSLPVKMWAYYSSSSMKLPIAFGEIRQLATNLSYGAGLRIWNGTLHHFTRITESDIFTFSAASHESLILLRSLFVETLVNLGAFITFPFVGDPTALFARVTGMVPALLRSGRVMIKGLPTILARPDSWVISLEVAKRSAPLNPDLSVWGGTDRFWAIAAGYTVICLLGAMYVSKGMPFSSSQVGREWEANIIDLLNQAGGVLKVILIISIEMLVFPLYCGLLLDAALLPLFDNTTIISRFLFTIHSPLTSIFVHWFVGTCYMFHFALFVSMCRKIMRKGVLYFIRDPDDPTFHPVRDVLERNVATQLRKILFSALVYGGLVVVCLGGVVWGLAYAVQGVLPIHWSSNEPVLEFPIDLLFYNFLMPLAVKFFKPSDGLHAMYTWWFRKCARMLRLTWFMFGERKLDEEGYVVHRTWGDFFRGVQGDPGNKMNPADVLAPFTEDQELRAYLHSDGRYVRAPASDQVRIPKGTAIFLEVDSENHPLDNKKDKKEGVHGKKNEHYKHVYVPPWFQVRIFLFIVGIWLFAAVTGVSITIVPLVVGRVVFVRCVPGYVRQNDIYAFSIGIYILGSILYAVLNLGTLIAWVRNELIIDADTPSHVLRKTWHIASWILRILWTYTAFLIVLPVLYALVVEMYFITPLHTYTATGEGKGEGGHTIHFVQSWTLGLLYVKLTTRLILWFPNSRPARSIEAIVARGYLDPDARLATRSFILPSLLLGGAALFWPWVVVRVLVGTVVGGRGLVVLMYRYAYPLTLAMGIWGLGLYVVGGWIAAWRARIRDEVYLIGERLHNFGDRKGVSGGVGVPRLRRLDT